MNFRNGYRSSPSPSASDSGENPRRSAGKAPRLRGCAWPPFAPEHSGRHQGRRPIWRAEMNLPVKALGERWRAIGVLPVVVTLSACAVTAPVPMAPTATSSLEMRPLSATEKATLAKTLSQALKDPGGSQFKWLPVAANGSGAIGYCGLVNVKGSDGGYVGFRRFFAMISKGPKGDYSKGRIEHIDGIPVTSGSG